MLTKRKVKVKVELSPPGKHLIGSKSADLLMVLALTILKSWNDDIHAYKSRAGLDGSMVAMWLQQVHQDQEISSIFCW